MDILGFQLNLTIIQKFILAGLLYFILSGDPVMSGGALAAAFFLRVQSVKII